MKGKAARGQLMRQQKKATNSIMHKQYHNEVPYRRAESKSTFFYKKGK